MYAVLGRTAKIECRARGSPPITYKWEKNGNELPSVNPRNNGKNGTYIIQTVRASDAGQYACVASNGPNPADAHKSFGRLELVGECIEFSDSNNRMSTILDFMGVAVKRELRMKSFIFSLDKVTVESCELMYRMIIYSKKKW